MKKLILLILLCITCSLYTHAQEKGIQFGVKAGLNIANLIGSEGDAVTSRTSIHFGVLAEIPFASKFSVQPELLFSSQGAKEEDSGDDLKLVYNYLNLPIIVKFYPITNFSIELGPQLGYLLSAKSKSDDPEFDDFDLKDLDVVKTLDFGFSFGLGYQLEMGLFAQGRYTLGISDTNDLDPEVGEDDVSVRNSVFQLSVGYKF